MAAEEVGDADGLGVEVGVVAVEGGDVVAVGEVPADAVFVDQFEVFGAEVDEVLLAAVDVDALEDEGAEVGIVNGLGELMGALEGPLFPLVRHLEFAGIEVVLAGVLGDASLAGLGAGTGGLEGIGAVGGEALWRDLCGGGHGQRSFVNLERS